MEAENKMQDWIDQEEMPKIYSSLAIRGFCVFFTTIFGGVLLMQNMLNIGNKKVAGMVLGGSILYTALSIYLVQLMDKPQTSLTLGINLIGGLILTEAVQKRFIPNESSHPKKKIWKPLIISILIIIPFGVAMFYSL
jgi:hypothetical protein